MMRYTPDRHPSRRHNNQKKRGRTHLLGHVGHLDHGISAKRVLLAASGPPPLGWSRHWGYPRLSWVSQVTETLPRLQPTAKSSAVLCQRSPDVATTALCLDKSSSSQCRGHFSTSQISHICMFVVIAQWVFACWLEPSWTSTKGQRVISGSNMSAFIFIL